MALWAGRFKKEINENVNAFNSSISLLFSNNDIVEIPINHT